MSWLSTLVGVFFIGHSLIGTTNPQMLRQVLEERAPEVQVAAQIINGAPLKINWNKAAEAEGANARVVLPQGGFNAVILTEGIPLDNHLEWNGTEAYARNFYDLALRSRPDTRVFLQETWHSLNSGTGVEVPYDDHDDIPWRDRIDRDLPKWQGVVDAVNAVRPEGAAPMALIPAGQAMGRLHDEIAAGTVPGLTGIAAVFSDDIHPNDLGFYFLTMVQYAVLTGESPVGLPRRLRNEWGKPYDAPDAALAERLQQIAWQVVQDHGALPVGAPPVPASAPAPATATGPATPLPGPGPADPPQPVGPVPMAIGLSGVTDWSVEQPFLDVMKTARTWLGHKPRQWAAARHADLQAAGYLDENGWPEEMPPELSSIGTLVLTDLPQQARSLAGRYRLRFDGDGIVEVAGRAKNVRYGKNEVQFDFSPGPGSVDIRIQRTDRRRTGDYVRNITVVKLEHAAAFDAGAVFNPDLLRRLEGFRAVRFMDWMLTNDSVQADWANRPKPDDYSYALRGVPAEVMVQLANRIGVDAWFNMPHMADDDYVRRFATLVRDRLWHEQKTYVEYSNEVWNWQFLQAEWADRMAQERWGKQDAWVQYHGMRAAEIAQIWTEVFGEAARDRLVNVIATQTGWIGLEKTILEAPLWVAEKPGRKPPAAHFDAYAVTGYFGGVLGMEDRAPMVRQWIADSRALAAKAAGEQGLSGAARDAYIAAHQYDAASALAWAELRDGLVSGDTTDTLADLLGRVLPHHAAVATQYGLDLIMYEGGSHVVGLGPMVDDAEITEFLIHFNYTPEMAALYTELINGWHRLGGTLFNVFADVYKPTKWGSWGTLRYLSDDNPRWDAVVAFQ